MTTFSIHTLGCRLNQADSASAVGDLTAHGYEMVPWGEPSDIIIINSCAVTGVASQKSRQAVRAARKRHPNAYLVLMGCEATIADASKYPEVDLVVPNPKPSPLSVLLPQPLSRGASTVAVHGGEAEEDFCVSGVSRYDDRTRANLKVQEGCDFYCTYCIVPYTRGPARSRNLHDILREADGLLQQGHRELVLTGVNITTYQNSGADLADLIDRLLSLGGDFRIRLGSAEPGPVVPKIIELMATNPRLCRFLHLPVQYGEDSVLERMGRHYTTERFAQLATMAAEQVPGVCLGTDIIVGFPGETDDSFQRCLDYMKRLPFGLMHVFTYSPRPGTPAAVMPNRPSKAAADERSNALLGLAVEKAENFAASQVGKTLDVLVEDSLPAAGWTDNYLHATFDAACRIPRNTLVKATITGTAGHRELTAVPEENGQL